MVARRITAAVVDGLTPDEVVWDAEVRGFGVRRRARDTGYLLKTRIAGKQRVFTIGRHGRGAWGPESARREAIRLLGVIRDGRDPAVERDEAKRAPTLATFTDRYLAEYARPQKKASSVAEDERLLRLHILPELGERRLSEIGRQDVARLHAAMTKMPVAANRTLSLVSAMFGWAERVGLRPDGTNPCRHVDRYPEKARERFLSAEELARLGDALDRASSGWTAETQAAWREQCRTQAKVVGIEEARRDAWVAARQPVRDSAEDWRALAGFRLLIFTGARLSEILTLRWDWIDAARGVARLPDSKTGAKNLHLPPGALEVLTALPRVGDNPYVLPGDRQPDAAKAGHFVGIQKPWQRVRALAGLPDVRIHDLRHSFASVAVAGGDSLFVVGKLLGHRQASTTERYAHLAHDPAKAVADKTGERLRALLNGGRGQDGEVVAHPAAHGQG